MSSVLFKVLGIFCFHDYHSSSSFRHNIFFVSDKFFVNRTLLSWRKLTVCTLFLYRTHFLLFFMPSTWFSFSRFSIFFRVWGLYDYGFFVLTLFMVLCFALIFFNLYAICACYILVVCWWYFKFFWDFVLEVMKYTKSPGKCEVSYDWLYASLKIEIPYLIEQQSKYWTFRI